MKKWIGNNWLSTIAFGLSIIAICLTICRIEPIDFNNGSMVSFVVGLMGICATIMVGMQIYSTIYSEEKINRRINEEGKKIKYEFGPRRAGDLPQFWADSDKAQKVLGWKTTRTLEDMCRDTWNWQSNNPNGYAK
jgi:GDP-D-mannose dehydratase